MQRPRMSRPRLLGACATAALLAALAWGCALPSGRGETPAAPAAVADAPAVSEPTVEQVGDASWYGPAQQGKETASGETFDQKKLTAAHRTLPLGTRAVVTNLENGQSVEVKINDRGPYAKGRKIDLSHAAAEQIGMTGQGVAKVKIEAKPRRRAAKRTPTRTPSVSPTGASPTATAVPPQSSWRGSDRYQAQRSANG